jgi:predicted glycosyl hydrolase (DUF1957 family)
VNGGFIEEEVFNDCDSLINAKIRFHNEENEDIKAAIITIIKRTLEMRDYWKCWTQLLVDEKNVTHKNGYAETIRIYKTKSTLSFLAE